MFSQPEQTNSPIATSCKFMRHPDEQSSSADHRNFGIFTLEVEQSEPKIDNMDWVLNIDRSGSMAEPCPDGKTKMQHIHHTLKNMVDYFLKLPSTIKQTLTIIAFDHEIDIICNKINIDASLKTSLPSILDKLDPRGATNIGAALAAAEQLISERTAASSSPTNTMHIFMSDGQITSGEHSKSKLVDIMSNTATSTDCKHAFVGFGIHHDDALLRHLSDATGGDYYFIDSLENAGMVYGEILYGCLYEHIQQLNVEIENGEFYNYKTNAWNKTLLVDYIASGQTRTWHVRSHACNVDESAVDGGSAAQQHNDTHFHISLNGTYRKINDETTHTLPPTDIEYPSQNTINKEVEKYHWRQRTQELMHEVKQFIAEEKVSPPSLYPGAAASRRFNVPPCPPVGRFVEESHLILDAAKQGVWSAVWAMLDKNPSLVNVLPNPRNYRLIHQAVYQQNIFALQTLLKRGATISLLTSDNKNVNQIVPAHSMSKELRNIIESAYALENPKDKRKDYGNQLDTFLKELKTYMTENDLEDNAFMQTLCDDIYITIRSLTSKYGGMYLHTRSASQGRERAYNITNIETLENDTSASYRSLGGQHGLSRSSTSAYASPQADNIMRQVSLGQPAPEAPC